VDRDLVVRAPSGDHNAFSHALSIFDHQPGPGGHPNRTWTVPLDGSPARLLSGPEFSAYSWQPVWGTTP
jgi:hypothetical protein